jgi:hypothetical protein
MVTKVQANNAKTSLDWMLLENQIAHAQMYVKTSLGLSRTLLFDFDRKSLVHRRLITGYMKITA